MRAYRTWDQIVKDHAPVETSVIDDPTIRDIRTKKPVPRVVEKKLRDAKVEAARVEIRAQVFARDHGLCRSCRAHATEMHELRFRSLGGKRSLENSIAVCTGFGGNNCHMLLQRNVIGFAFVKPKQGANGPIRFSTGSRVWISEARA